ncbi:MAG: elongation factor P [bacterium]|nr:elongation factor P [bacterium]
MLSYTDLTKGTVFVMNGEPYEILETNFVRMQQRKPVVQGKIKNLLTGKVVSRTFHQSETFEEAEIEKKEAVFVYEHRGKFIFTEPDSPSARFELDEGAIGEQKKFLKPNLIVTRYIFNDTVINIALPIKIDYLVKEAPPNVKGDTATGGNKIVTLENGLEMAVPMFINQGDVIRVNTVTGEYTERVEKK